MRLFSDVLFAVSLFAVWGLLTLIGVIIDQGKSEAFYFSIYPAPVARTVTRLGLDTIYHGPAYLGIIAAILVSLAVCTFKRVIPARLPPLRAVTIEHVPLNARLHWAGDEAAIRERFTQFLKGRGWQIRARTFESIEWTFADKSNWARRGVLVAHVGFVIIAAGTCIYWARGYSGDFTTMTRSDVGHHADARAYHARRFPLPHRSHHDQGRDRLSTHRLCFAGARNRSGRGQRDTRRSESITRLISTASPSISRRTAWARVLAITHAGKSVAGLPSTAMQEGDGFTLPGTTRSVEYTRFVGTIGADGVPGKDPRPNNPGVVILSIFDGDTHAGDVLVPFGRTVDLGGGFALTPASTQFYSGFQYRYDPGIPLVGIGAFVLLAGLCIAFYLLPARLYARIDGAGQAWTLSLAATTVKGYTIFEEQFGDLVKALGDIEPPHSSSTPRVTA